MQETHLFYVILQLNNISIFPIKETLRMDIDIRKLIGESTSYDKKEMVEVKRPKSWLKSVSAFANG